MWGRTHNNLDIDLYLPLDEFIDISSSDLERELCCELPKLDGTFTGRKAYLQCEDFNETDEIIKGEYKEGNYFIKLAKHILNPTDETGHFAQIDEEEISVTLYIFEMGSL